MPEMKRFKPMQKALNKLPETVKKEEIKNLIEKRIKTLEDLIVKKDEKEKEIKRTINSIKKGLNFLSDFYLKYNKNESKLKEEIAKFEEETKKALKEKKFENEKTVELALSVLKECMKKELNDKTIFRIGSIIAEINYLKAIVKKH